MKIASKVNILVMPKPSKEYTAWRVILIATTIFIIAITLSKTQYNDNISFFLSNILSTNFIAAKIALSIL